MTMPGKVWSWFALRRMCGAPYGESAVHSASCDIFAAIASVI